MATNRYKWILVEELQKKTIFFGESSLKERLKKILAPMMPPQTFHDVYAVVSLTSDSSLVIREKEVYRCDLPPEKLVIEGLKSAYHLNLDAYRRAVNRQFQRITYKIPMAFVDGVLFPLTGEACTLWLNPAHIEDAREKLTTIVQLTNGLELEIPIKLRSFWELALNALIVYIGIKREYDPRTPFDLHDLHCYLAIEHTTFTNRLLDKLEIEPHLIPRGQFHRCFLGEQFAADHKERYGE